jgi:hypothetical protein
MVTKVPFVPQSFVPCILTQSEQVHKVCCVFFLL